MTPVDHRRATAERNRAAIVDAAERLLSRHGGLSMAALAAEAGVSRPTLYAHFKTLAEVVEAAVQRAVDASLAAIEAADPGSGPPGEALERMLEASWRHLAAYEALARGAAEHLPGAHLHRAHAPLMAHSDALVRRGQADGSFRTDLPPEWLVGTYYALVHAADEMARTQGVGREDALAMLRTTVRDVFTGPAR